MLRFVALLSVAAVVVLGARPPPHTPHPDHHHGSSICEFIKNADCTVFASHKVCGSDTKTYHSKCEFSQAHCTHPDLHVAHNGTCDPTIDKPLVHGNDLVHQFFCNNLKHNTCGTDREIVCGSDKMTYDNLCLFEKARCMDPNLQIHTYQACP